MPKKSHSIHNSHKQFLRIHNNPSERTNCCLGTNRRPRCLHIFYMKLFFYYPCAYISRANIIKDANRGDTVKDCAKISGSIAPAACNGFLQQVLKTQLALVHCTKRINFSFHIPWLCRTTPTTASTTKTSTNTNNACLYPRWQEQDALWQRR